MKVVSNLELVSNNVSTVKVKKEVVCKKNKQIFHAGRTSLTSKNKPVLCEEDVFSLLDKVERYLQKDLDKFHKIAKDFDQIDKNLVNSIRGKRYE